MSARSTFHRLLARLRAPFESRQLDRDLDDELAAHVQMRADDLVRRGLSPEAAARAARLELGGAAQLREAHRAVRGLPVAEMFWTDLRYGLRTLRRDASFTIFAVLIVGLGLGASAAVFSVVNALLLRPLPFPDARQLVWISNVADDGVADWTTQVNHFLDLRAQNRTFSDLAGYNNFMEPGDRKLTGAGEPERLSSVAVTQNFFALLGIRPQLGRTFTADECRFGGPAAAILTYRLWQRRFASDPAIVGRRLTLNAQPVTVVGVMPESFDFGSVFAPGRRVESVHPVSALAGDQLLRQHDGGRRTPEARRDHRRGARRPDAAGQATRGPEQGPQRFAAASDDRSRST